MASNKILAEFNYYEANQDSIMEGHLGDIKRVWLTEEAVFVETKNGAMGLVSGVEYGEQ